MENDNTMKFITYRKDRDVWQVRFRGTSGRMVTKSFKKMEDAIAYRDKFINVYELDKKIVVPRKPLQKVPIFSKAFDIYIEEKSLSLKPATIHHLITTKNFLSEYVGDIPLDKITEWQRIFAGIYQTRKVSYDYITKKYAKHGNCMIFMSKKDY